eukprot:TRINITY_DN5426_c0_g1_i1.p1 TRINITY_DN5426_c0_g1~~TRINITY_DN5426_c0_g1_i1.p1  ORF type:complete len:559 (+),score=121.55 TRINITY_DN5426_c0_g1_i1:137-1678(+)
MSRFAVLQAFKRGVAEERAASAASPPPHAQSPPPEVLQVPVQGLGNTAEADEEKKVNEAVLVVSLPADPSSPSSLSCPASEATPTPPGSTVNNSTGGSSSGSASEVAAVRPHSPVAAAQTSPVPACPVMTPTPPSVQALSPPAPILRLKPKASFDMFCDSPVAALVEEDVAEPPKQVNVCEDDKRDETGQYTVHNGEVLNNRYVVVGSFGDGMYSRVLRALDRDHQDQEVAIKVHRHNMNQTAQNEKRVLETVSSCDACIRLLDSFEDKHGNLCLVFEPMSHTLRQLLQQYRGRRGGLHVSAVRVYARALMTALRHLKHQGLVHADIKLDNILVSAGLGRCKVADFGCACVAPGGVSAKTGTLCARFYRPPENLLGLPCGYALDMWGAGCCLFELATGKFAFSGATNNAMLWHQLQVTGAPPRKLVRQAPRVASFFDDRFNFIPEGSSEGVPVPVVPTRDVKAEITALSSLVTDPADKLLLTQLADLIARIFVFDPQKRLKVEDALQHPFIVA